MKRINVLGITLLIAILALFCISHPKEIKSTISKHLPFGTTMRVSVSVHENGRGTTYTTQNFNFSYFIDDDSPYQLLQFLNEMYDRCGASCDVSETTGGTFNRDEDYRDKQEDRKYET